MNFIQIMGSSITPDLVHSIVSCNLTRTQSPVLCVNFHQPLADVVFLFRDNIERDNKFNDIRKVQEE